MDLGKKDSLQLMLFARCSMFMLTEEFLNWRFQYRPPHTLHVACRVVRCAPVPQLLTVRSRVLCCCSGNDKLTKIDSS